MVARSDSDTTTDSVPLCVDLDGTLVKSDTLWEALFVVLRRRPLEAFSLPLWVFRGKARFKQRVADLVDVDPASLPYNEDLLGYLREQADRGRPIVLATAAHNDFAKRIADHLGFFTDIVASDAANNLSGERKLERLEQRYGSRFDYAGNAKIDLPIFARARRAIVVNPHAGVEKHARKASTVEHMIETRGPRLPAYWRAIRVHQWLKNLLVFLPLLASHRLELALFAQAALAFLAFGLCASSAYLLNDLLDLAADRNHDHKRHRPLARGDLAIPSAVLLSLALLVGGMSLSALALPATFLALLAAYYVTTLLYSFFLKRIALVDVLALAGLYTLRVLAGGAAIAIMPSFWLLAFSMFIFLSLALVKRGAELEPLDSAGIAPIGRGYARGDLEPLKTMGVASGYMAVLVVALYINSEEVLENYSRPQLLWLVCPLLLYWVSRLWLKTSRGQMHHDPLVFAIRDPVSQILGVLILASVLAAV